MKCFFVLGLKRFGVLNGFDFKELGSVVVFCLGGVVVREWVLMERSWSFGITVTGFGSGFGRKRWLVYYFFGGLFWWCLVGLDDFRISALFLRQRWSSK